MPPSPRELLFIRPPVSYSVRNAHLVQDVHLVQLVRHFQNEHVGTNIDDKIWEWVFLPRIIQIFHINTTSNLPKIDLMSLLRLEINVSSQGNIS